MFLLLTLWRSILSTLGHRRLCSASASNRVRQNYHLLSQDVRKIAVGVMRNIRQCDFKKNKNDINTISSD